LKTKTGSIQTRSDILQGQALFRGVKQLRKKMDKKQRDRQTKRKKTRKDKKEKEKKRKREKEKKRKKKKRNLILILTGEVSCDPN